MTDIDVVRCMECGYYKEDPASIPRSCPDCDAEFNNYWKEKIFADKEVSSGE